MREIKFRIWYPNKKRFSDKLDDITDCLMDIKNGKLVFNVYELANKDTTDIKYFVDNGYILMQYTGLKDRNGKEIYEGDIVNDDEGTIFQIKWDERETKAGFKLYLEFTDKQHFKIGKYLEFDSCLSPDNCLEVIGNIYENPEVFKEG